MAGAVLPGCEGPGYAEVPRETQETDASLRLGRRGPGLLQRGMIQHPLRIGVAGAGHFGRFHALKVAKSSRAVLAGLFDPDHARAAAVGREAGGAAAMPWAELLSACDAVIVAAPAEAHFALATQALRCRDGTC